MKAASEPTIAESIKRASEWQMLKRDLYAGYLASGRALRNGTQGESEVSEYLGSRDKVLLFGSDEVASAVMNLPKDLSGVDDATWDHLIQTLKEHSRDPAN